MMPPLSVHLIDGTYELYRQFYGRRRFEKAHPAPLGAVAGVLHSILEMIEKGATHIGVATDQILDAAGVRARFGVDPERIPDFLALVGDAADGYPGLAGIGPVGAAQLIHTHGKLEDFPPAALGKNRELALLFKDLATLRSDARLFANVKELRWRGPTEAFPSFAARIGDEKLLLRCLRAAEGLG